MSPLRWGVIGGSDIAATRMIPAMRAVGHLVVAVAGSNRERSAAFAAAHDVPGVATSAEHLANRDDVDAVYISSPNHLHAEHGLAAIAAGRPVLCEKPLALDLTDADRMVQAARLAGVPLAVNHHLPAHTTHAEVRRLISIGAIGRLLAVRVSFAFELAPRLRGWRLTDARVGGPVLDLMPHVAAVVGKIAGRPLEVVALATRQGPWQAAAEDAAMCVTRYAGDVLCQAHLGWTTPFARNALEVVGSEGSVIATDVMRADPGGSVVVLDAGGIRTIDFPRHDDAYQVTVRCFGDAVAGTGEPVVTAAEGRDALAVTLAARDAAATERAVPVPSSGKCGIGR